MSDENDEVVAVSLETPSQEISALTAEDIIEAVCETAEVVRFQSRDAAFADAEVLEGFQVLPPAMEAEAMIAWLSALMEEPGEVEPSETGEDRRAEPTQSNKGLRDDPESDAMQEAAPLDPWEEARALFDRTLVDDLRLLRSSSGTCLYSARFMTDAYARWLFLAREGDDAATFASCVREESRLYPRPMKAVSLSREPFHLSEQRLAELFEVMRGSDEYADIRTTTASNGDVYYFSSDSLSDGYARSLAEWYSVDYWDNP